MSAEEVTGSDCVVVWLGWKKAI